MRCVILSLLTAVFALPCHLQGVFAILYIYEKTIDFGAFGSGTQHRHKFWVTGGNMRADSQCVWGKGGEGGGKALPATETAGSRPVTYLTRAHVLPTDRDSRTVAFASSGFFCQFF